jgi:mono/diheme cytochrome c family protein
VIVGMGLALFLIEGKAQMGGDVMGSGQSGQTGALPGETLFSFNCSNCHPNGGNTIIPGLPLRGSPKLMDFDTFLSYIRHPKMPNGSPGPMPPFPSSRISNDQARELYQYLKNMEKTSGPVGSQWGPGMRGYGPGMMQRYGMGPGMMGPGYG